MITTNDFNKLFKKNVLADSKELAEDITKILELPEYHYTKFLFFDYYTFYKSDKLLDINIIKKIIRDNIQKGYAFILKDKLENKGKDVLGAWNYNRENYFTDEVGLEMSNEERYEIESANEKKTLELLKSEYWKNNNEWEVINKIELYEDREPKNMREVFHRQSGGKFFNPKNTLLFYELVIAHFLPEYKYNPKISKKKEKRYTKNINEDYAISLYIDFGFIEKEIKYGYIEFPVFSIDFHKTSLDKFIEPFNYTSKYSEIDEVDICRILYYSITNEFRTFGLSRIGNSWMEGKEIAKDLVFYFDSYSMLLKLYLKYIKKNILKTISEIQNK